MNGTRIDDTLAAAIWPLRATAAKPEDSETRRSGRLARDAALCLVGVAALTISAKIAVPFVPVPMTLQTLAVLLLGAAYGVRLSALSVIAYLACGLGGLPVFANTPPLLAGPAYLLGPTGGFLLGFIPAAALMGFAAEKRLDRGFFKACLPVALIADAIIFGCGFAWLAFAARIGSFHGIGTALAWSKGVAPFLLGDAVKATLAGAVFPALWSFVGPRPSSA
jgi:biotin transport system substrate-specific component